MRQSWWCLTILAAVFASGALAACGDKPIGQPCNFGWPKTAEGEFDCSDYPACHPLQETGGEVTINNMACPVDCIQMPSMECENLICVATQIPAGENKFTHVNGKCTTDNQTTDCPTAPVACAGYCTKECLSDASCPGGYTCSAMAPFGANLHCEDMAAWGEECTATCAGPSEDANCPATTDDDWDRTLCDNRERNGCCACICNQFCPLLAKKFCRKEAWDDKMFPDSKVHDSMTATCGPSGG